MPGQQRPPRHLPVTRAERLRTGSSERPVAMAGAVSIRLRFVKPHPCDSPTASVAAPQSVTDSFTHLHVHTEFSMLDGAARLDELVAKAVADGQPAIGITDHGNMYGTLEFYKECNKQGIKPIIGTEAYMAHDHRTERPTRRGRIDDSGGDTEGGKKLYYHLTLLAENETGYRNLIQLSSLAFLEGYYYKPRMDWELLEKYHDGLIATTGCLGGHVLQALLKGDEKGALAKAGRLQDIFGKDNLFVELQDHGLQAQRDTNPKLVEIAKQIGAPLLATNDSHYTHREDHESHDALLCVQTGALLSDPKRFKFEGTEHYLKTAARDALPVPRGPRGVRQHAVDRRARPTSRSSSASRCCRTSRCPQGFADDAAYLDHLTWEGAQRALGRRPARRRAPSGSPTSSRSSTTWGSRRTS